MAIARVGTPGLCFVTTVLAASFSVTFQSCTISALTVAGVSKPAQIKVAKRKRDMENLPLKKLTPTERDNAPRPPSRRRTTGRPLCAVKRVMTPHYHSSVFTSAAEDNSPCAGDGLRPKPLGNLLDTQLRKEIVDDAKAV